MILSIITVPYLLPAVMLLSLLHLPFMAPVPNAVGVTAQRASEYVACGEDAGCWSGFYRGLLDVRGSAVALGDLKARTLAREPVYEFCHELLHDIGGRAYEETGDVSRAYRGGDPFCRAGYYHGVLEGAFGVEGPTLLEHLDDLCRSVPGRDYYSYQYFSCVHGIGHGLMAYTGNDLFGSLEGCALLAGEWERSSCAGGVFMESAASANDEPPHDDPLYPCTVVAERFVDACYLMQSSRILAANGGDFSQTFSACRSVAGPRRTICFESIGRDASGYSHGDADAVRGLCENGIDTHERDHCMIGAAIDYIQTHGGEQALALCDLAEGTALCRSRVESHLDIQ